MKIAVSAIEPGLEAKVDPRFGRAGFFVIVDTDTGGFEVKDNKQNLDAPQGAGIQSARNVAETGAEAVITGHMGPNAFRTLTAAGIKIFLARDTTVAQAVEDYKSGALQLADTNDKEGHWM